MDIRVKIREVLREQYGDFSTDLEHMYEDKVITSLAEGNAHDRRAWATYNQIILELKHSIKDMLRETLIKELQYRLTDKTDPNQVCVDVLDKISEKSPELERLYYKVRNFIR